MQLLFVLLHIAYIISMYYHVNQVHAHAVLVVVSFGHIREELCQVDVIVFADGAQRAVGRVVFEQRLQVVLFLVKYG